MKNLHFFFTLELSYPGNQTFFSEVLLLCFLGRFVLFSHSPLKRPGAFSSPVDIGFTGAVFPLLILIKTC